MPYFKRQIEPRLLDLAQTFPCIVVTGGRQAGKTVADLLVNRLVLVVPQSRESFLAGLQLYRARPDKGYSLTDCISMETMRREGLTDVLTNDRHFEQEGFRALFRDS